MARDKVDELYEALAADGIVTKSRDNFREYFFAPKEEGYRNRKALYDALKSDGLVESGSYEEFRDKLGLRVGKRATSPGSNTPITSVAAKPQRPKVQPDGTSAHIKKPAGWGELNTESISPSAQYVDGKYNPIKAGRRRASAHQSDDQTLNEMAERGNIHAKRALQRSVSDKQNDTHKKTEGSLLKADGVDRVMRQKKDQLDYAIATGEMLRNPVDLGMSLDADGNVVGNPMYAPTVARDENGNMILGEDGKPLIGMSTDEKRTSAYRNTMDDTVKAEKRRRAEEETQRKALDLDMAKEDIARIETEMEEVPVSSEDYWMLRAARNAVEDRIKDIEAVRDEKNGSFLGGLWRGFRDAAFDAANWNFGVTDTYEAVMKERARTNAVLGEETAASRELAEQSYNADRAAGNREVNVGNGYTWGQIAGQSAPFAVDFLIGNEAGLLNGVKGAVTRVATRAGTRAGKAVLGGASRFGLDLGKRVTNFGKAVVKNTGIALGDIGAAATLSTTVQAGKTGADMLNRYTGSVTFDPSTGQYRFEGGETMGDAIYKGLTNSVVENYTEMLGEHFNLGKWGNQLLNKVGLKRASEMISRMSSSESYKTVNEWMRKAGYNGYVGEVLEEEAGIPLHALTDGSSEMSDLIDPKQQMDIVGGMAFSMGVTGGAMTAVHGAGRGAAAAMYYRDKHKLDILDKVASFRMTQEVWKPIKEILDNAENKDIQEVFYQNVIDNDNLLDQEKEAAWQYAQRLIYMRGHNIGQQMAASANAHDGNTDNAQGDAAYTQGYTMKDPQKMNDAKNMYEYQRQRMQELVGEEKLALLDDDPVNALNNILGSDVWTEKEKQSAKDYVNAKATYDGMMQGVTDDIESRIAQSDALIDSQTKKGTNVVQRATMKIDDRPVHIIDGNVVLNEDGSISTKESDESIIIRDDETGKVEFVAPTAILSVDEEQDAEELKAAARENINMIASQEAENKINGVLPMNPGDVVTINDDGGQTEITIVGPVIDEKSGMPIDGQVMVQFADGTQSAFSKNDIQQFANVAAMERLNEYNQEQKDIADAEATEEKVERREYKKDESIEFHDEDGNLVYGVITQEPNSDNGDVVWVDYYDNPERSGAPYRMNALKRDDFDRMIAAETEIPENPELMEEMETPELAEESEETLVEEPMPMVGEGEEAEPDFSQTTPQRAHTYIYNEAGLDRDEANQFVEANKKAADKTLSTVHGKKPKMGTSLAKYHKEMADWQQKVADAQLQADYWKQVEDEQKKIIDAEAQARAEREAIIQRQAAMEEQQRQEEELRKREEQAQLGSNNVAPQITEKWNAAPKVEGVRNEITLANGERVAGRYVLVESGAATPSHNPSAEFIKNDGFPMDEHGQSVNDRDYERDKDAQTVTRQIAGRYDSRALQTPVVVSNDGVVLSGNGRTMAGELAAQDNTDGAYIDHLKKYGSQFGFTTEQVESMAHPRVLFVPDETMPYTADTFAKFNQQEMKGQSKAEQAVKLGKIVDESTFGRIIKNINSYDTLGDFYADTTSAANAINELAKSGAISQAQYAEMFDGDTISAQGREILENMLIGKAFEGNPDAVREITAYKSVRQSVICALAEISNNLLLGEEYSLEGELAQAIDLVYQARQAGYKAGERVSGYARQLNLFPFDEGETVADYRNATTLMLADVLNDNRVTRLKKVLAVYNHQAQDSAGGQMDLFTGEVKSKEEILNTVKTLLENGTEEEQQSAVNAAVEQRKAASVQQDGVDGGRSGGSEDAGGNAAGQSDLAQTEVNAPLSDEVNEFDKPFVLSSDGTTTFGEVTEDSGLTAAPIKLSLGENRTDDSGADHGYGLLHIEAGHGGQIRAAGFASVEEFVETVAKNYDTIREGNAIANNQTYLLEVSDEHNNTLFIQLSRDGSYWNVNSAGIFRKKYSRRMRKVASLPTIENSSSTETVEVNRGQSNGATATSENSSLTFVGKDTKKSRNNNELDEENVEKEEKVAESRLSFQELRSKYPDRVLGEQRKDGSVTYHDGDALLVSKLLNHNFDGTELTLAKDEADRALRELIVNGHKAAIYGEEYNPKEMQASLTAAESETNTSPTDKQKEAGNYKKGHVRIDGFDISIENPKGSERKGTDASGKPWSVTMNNTYGYIRRTEGVDGDHIDVFLSDDLDGWNGTVYVVDQVNTDGSFDEHKVMYGFNSEEEARAAYLSNYSEGWQGLGAITGVTKDDFKKWVDSSHRKTKAFAEYKSVKAVDGNERDGEKLHKRSGVSEKNAAGSSADVALRDALVDRLRESGIDVVTDMEEGQRVLDEANSKVQMQAKKRALETASLESDSRSLTVVPSADGAKVLKNLETTIHFFENSSTQPKTFIGDVAKALGAKRYNSKSEYATFETKNGRIVTIRLADHNAKVSNFDRRGELDGISIVVSPKRNAGIINDGDAHIVEYYYDAIRLRRAKSKPLADIVRSIQQALYSGEFTDTTGLGVRQEVNRNEEREQEQSSDVRYFRTASGEAYGFVKGGKIYIDPRIAKSDTPIHEYAHLWAEALRQRNAEEWRNVVELMKGTSVWEEVKSSYPELKTDDEIADEAIAKYSGKRGAERLRKAQEEVLKGDGDVMEKAATVSALERVKEALGLFWKGVADFLHIHYNSAEYVADRVLKDLLDGVNPEVEARKDRQLDRINDTNPMLDDYHTGIRSANDIRTLREAIQDAREEANGDWDELSAYPDVDNSVYENALESGEITVYSSKPITDGNFVTPSRMQAEEYAGGGKVYSKTVSIDDVAWITTDEGQMAAIGKDNVSEYPMRMQFVGENGAANMDNAESPEELTRAGTGLQSDEDVSMANDPWAKMWGKSFRTKEQKRAFAEHTRKNIERHIKELVEKLHLDNVEIVADASELSGKRAQAKGFYNKGTGKITIVLSNHSGIADIEQTLLHEAVAHYGLRQLFGKQFDTFLDNVYSSAGKGIRGKIAEMAAKNGWDFRTATEEYLASLAEDTNFEDMDASWWREIKRRFVEFLHDIGFTGYADFDMELSDNELRYILWRSYENLAEPGRYRSILGEAADVAMQNKLQVGNYANVADEEMTKVAEDEDLFRPLSERDRIMVRDEYERMVSSGRNQFIEAVQDSMMGLKSLYQSISGKGTHIEDIPGFENAYLYENRMSSTNAAEQSEYYVKYMKPLVAEINHIIKQSGAKRNSDIEEERRALTDYLMAKHGLERNSYMRTQAKQEGKDTERDFAGLTALTGIDDWQSAEAEAQRMVDEYEAEYNTDNLWEAVNNATKAILYKMYIGGILSKERYEEIRDMYEYYVPLRGWDETTSEEVYGYMTSKNGPLGGSIMKQAKGRNSKADDPIATIAMMADDGIRQSNRNIMKQRFLNFVLNNPSDVVSVNDLWLRYDEVTDEWVPVFPDINKNDSPEDVERIVNQFEEDMRQLSKQNPDKYKRGNDASQIPYKVVRGNLKEHQILVKRNGRTYVLTINGNPRAAQALNGLTNPDVETGGVVGNFLKGAEYVNRQLSAFYTTRNPDFVAGNFLRDALYANCMTWVKESPRYALRFHRNFGRVNPAVMRYLLGKWENGTLSDSGIEGMFYLFMKNGGETGYTNVKDIKGHKKAVASEMKRQNGGIGRKAWDSLGEQFDLLNRSVENCARFAAFVTSREMGRSIDRSIWDAKEVSVNFNKKGSGGKMLDATGQTFLGKTGAYLGGSGRLLYVFWNAGVQGMTNFGRNAVRHPVKASIGASALFALGYAIPLLAQMLGSGDDDDKNAYYNLPEYIRRSNICFRSGEQWITIPLPIEYRAIYGMGELACGVITGNERYSDTELAFYALSQVSQMMPLDVLEGGGGVSPFVPSLAKPLTEAYIMNKEWTGLPIYKDTPFNKIDPEWTKAYQSADQTLVGMARWLNEVSGGDDYKKGKININPAKIEYMLNGYFGGMFTFPMKIKKSVETMFGDRDFEWRNTPILNRVVKSGDERTANRKLQNEYFKYKKETEETGKLFRNYKKAGDEGVMKYAEKADFLYNSPDYLRYEIFEAFKPDMDDFKEELKTESNKEKRKEIEKEMYGVMRELVDNLNDPAKYIDSLRDAGVITQEEANKEKLKLK